VKNDALKTALAAQRPIPTDREELEIERLISADQRRVTIAEVEQFRESLAPPPAVDPIDLLVEEIRRGGEGA
jgi:hypothetical protein